jgi:hypothetical protein
MSKRSELLKQRYADDPEYRESVLAGNRARYDRRKDEINADKRLRYASDPEYRHRFLGRDKSKRRDQNLRRNYGISLAEFEAILAHQDHACAICRERFTNTPHVDHDHDTRVVRGLLCSHCNHGLGCFGDDIEIMESAIDYLECDTSTLRCIAPRRRRKRSARGAADTCRLGRALARPNTSLVHAQSLTSHAVSLGLARARPSLRAPFVHVNCVTT